MSKLKNKTTSKTKSNQIQKNKLNEHGTQIWVLDTWAKGEHCFNTSKHGISKLGFRKNIKIKNKRSKHGSKTC